MDWFWFIRHVILHHVFWKKKSKKNVRICMLFFTILSHSLLLTLTHTYIHAESLSSSSLLFFLHYNYRFHFIFENRHILSDKCRWMLILNQNKTTIRKSENLFFFLILFYVLHTAQWFNAINRQIASRRKKEENIIDFV